MAAKKTKLMLEVERTAGEPIEIAIPRLIEAHGKDGAAKALGVSENTLRNWRRALDLEVKTLHPVAQRVERELGEPIEVALPRMVEEMGYYETARALGIHKNTPQKWMEKWGMKLPRGSATQRRVERDIGAPLSKTLPPLVAKLGKTGAAKRLGVNVLNIHRWMKKIEATRKDSK